MASIIPFFILLLTAYTFSAPIGQENENSTVEYEYTTDQTTVSWDLIFNNQSTGLPIVQKQRSVEDSSSTEVTTDYVTRPPRAALSAILAMRDPEDPPPKPSKTSSSQRYPKRGNDYSSSSEETRTNEKRDSKESLISTSTSGYKKRSDAAYQDSFESENNEKRESSESVRPTSTKDYKKRSDAAYQDSFESASSEKRDSKESLISTSTSGYKKNTPKSYLFTTLESSTVFNRRAIRPIESEEEPESTSVYPEKQMKMNTYVKPSSSVDSFGKATGLLNDKPVNESSEESQTPLPIQTQKITKTVSIIPGKVSKTEVVPNVSTKSSVMMQPIQQEQLSQGQSQSES